MIQPFISLYIFKSLILSITESKRNYVNIVHQNLRQTEWYFFFHKYVLWVYYSRPRVHPS